MNGKGHGRIWSQPDIKYYFDLCVEGFRDFINISVGIATLSAQI
jgi:hypothetical protein